jgi:uncharacterized metal-binding protein YceD (DUF177 family)
MNKIIDKQLINFNIKNLENETLFEIDLKYLTRFQSILSSNVGVIQFSVKIVDNKMHLKATDNVVQVQCQRCLNDIDYHSSFDEEHILSFKTENEDDILIIDNKINLLDILEDSLILTVDIAPKCDFDCNQFLNQTTNTNDLAADNETYQPFANFFNKTK